MILADTSSWIDHFHRPNASFHALLHRNEVLMHPFVLGEIACGNLGNRSLTIANLRQLGRAPIVHEDEVLDLIDVRRLFGKGLGFVDVHLLASARMAKCSLMTKDRALFQAAQDFGVALGS